MSRQEEVNRFISLLGLCKHLQMTVYSPVRRWSPFIRSSNHKRAFLTLKKLHYWRISFIYSDLDLLESEADRMRSVTWLLKNKHKDESKHEPWRIFCPTNPDCGPKEPLDTSSVISSFLYDIKVPVDLANMLYLPAQISGPESEG